MDNTSLQEKHFKIPIRVADKTFYLCFDVQVDDSNASISMFVVDEWGFTVQVPNTNRKVRINLPILLPKKRGSREEAIKEVVSDDTSVWSLLMFTSFFSNSMIGFEFGKFNTRARIAVKKERIDIDAYDTVVSVASQFPEKLQDFVFFIEMDPFSALNFLRQHTFKDQELNNLAKKRVQGLFRFYERIKPLSNAEKVALMSFKLDQLDDKIWTIDYSKKIVKELLERYYELKGHWFIPIAGDCEDSIDRLMYIYLQGILYISMYACVLNFTIERLSNYLYQVYLEMGLNIKEVIEEFNMRQYNRITKGNTLIGYITDSFMKHQNAFPAIRAVSKSHLLKVNGQSIRVVDHPIIDGKKYNYDDIRRMTVEHFLHTKEKFELPISSVILPKGIEIEK